MSTYFSLCCDECKEVSNFVKRSGAWVYMAGAMETIPDFVGKHNACEGSIFVISEHDHRWSEYTTWPKEDEA